MTGEPVISMASYARSLSRDFIVSSREERIDTYCIVHNEAAIKNIFVFVPIWTQYTLTYT
jgi:hypothetical protein